MPVYQYPLRNVAEMKTVDRDNNASLASVFLIRVVRLIETVQMGRAVIGVNVCQTNQNVGVVAIVYLGRNAWMVHARVSPLTVVAI